MKQSAGACRHSLGAALAASMLAAAVVSLPLDPAFAADKTQTAVLTAIPHAVSIESVQVGDIGPQDARFSLTAAGAGIRALTRSRLRAFKGSA